MPKLKTANYFGVLIGASLLYIILTLTGPINPASTIRFNLSDTAIRLLQLTIAIPIIAIWAAAFWGAVRFKKYAETIANSPDGQALTRVSNGLVVLAIGLVIVTLFGALQAWLRGTDLIIPFTIINRYLGIAYPLLAFWLMYKGTHDLKKLIKKPIARPGVWLFAGGLIAAIAVFYVKSLFNLPVRNSMDPAQTGSLFLPDSLILLTVVLPTVATWVLGAASAINISAYHKDIAGVLYKEALLRLATGLLFIIIFSVSLSLLVALEELFRRAGLNTVLGIVYLIIILWAIGYLLIASGAKKLMKIESV